MISEENDLIVLETISSFLFLNNSDDFFISIKIAVTQDLIPFSYVNSLSEVGIDDLS